jgi:hypothetical protein
VISARVKRPRSFLGRLSPTLSKVEDSLRNTTLPLEILHSIHLVKQRTKAKANCFSSKMIALYSSAMYRLRHANPTASHRTLLLIALAPLIVAMLWLRSRVAGAKTSQAGDFRFWMQTCGSVSTNRFQSAFNTSFHRGDHATIACFLKHCNDDVYSFRDFCRSLGRFVWSPCRESDRQGAVLLCPEGLRDWLLQLISCSLLHCRRPGQIFQTELFCILNSYRSCLQQVRGLQLLMDLSQTDGRADEGTLWSQGPSQFLK